MKNKILLLVLLFMGLSHYSNAQTCGTAEPSTNPIPTKMHPAYKMFVKNFAPNGSRSMLLDTIPYKIHVVRTTAGTGGISTTDLTSAFNIVNGYYANANMYFEQCGAINYIDNSTYYDFFTSDEASITGANNVTNVINIYFFNTVTTSAGSSLCGYAYFPGGQDVIVMKNSCATNGSTLSHEIGHYFNLYHTHSTSNGAEYVNGTNCSTTGDLLCDTPADPQLSTSTVNTSCIYTGTATDPLGAAYTPDPTNIMSYSRKTCRTYFSPQQYARMSFSNINQRAYLSCSSGSGGSGLINGCAGTSQYPAATLTPTTSWQTNTNLYAGEYSIYNVVSGQTYEWSTCAADGGLASYDTELTLTDLSNNELAYSNDDCGSQSKIIWTSTITGTVRVHLTEDHCLTNTTGTNIVYKYQSGSPNLTKQTDNLTVSGNSVTVSATIENTGTSGAGSFDVRFYASTNTIISTGDVPIYTATVNSLAAAATTIVGSTIDLCTAGLTNNTTYYIGYIIDYNNSVSESNESDNTFAWTTQSATLNCTTGCLSTSQYPSTIFTPTATWQTAATNIYAGEYSVYNVVAGTTYEWSLCATDGGSASYDSELTLTDASNNFLAYEDDFCGDDAKITWVSTVTGTVRVHVTEYNCQTNSTNTTLVYQSVGGGGSSPNLLSAGGGTLSMTGTTANVTVNIENNGTGAAGAFDVRFYASTNTTISTGDAEIYVSSIASLASSTTTQITFSVDLCNVTGFSPSGSYYIGYLIDEPNQVTESNESDNGYYFNTANAINCVTNYTITTNVSPLGTGTVTGSGTYSNGSSATVTATPNSGWVFDSWKENGTTVSNNASYIFTVSADRTLEATFTQVQYTITTTANPTIGGTVSGGGTYNNGSSATVTATANAGWIFDSWKENGATVSTNFSFVFTVTGNRTLEAVFTQQQYTIATSANPSIGGTTSGGGTYLDGSSVTVTATANSGWTFDSWEENGSTVSNNATYTFTAGSNRTLEAIFTQQQYTITTNASPLSGGAVTGSGTYNSGSSATVTATANSGWVFDSWEENGNTVSSNASYTFTVGSNRTLEAIFTQVQYTITTSGSPTNGGSITGGGTYNSGSSATLTAISNPGWMFVSWQENGSTIWTDSTYTFTVNGDRTLDVIFDIDVSANGILNDVQINVSPNPTSDLVNIVIEHPTFDFDKIQVYNIHGQLMKSANMNRNNSIQMDLGSLSEGVYFIQIFTTDNQQFVIKKVVKTN